MSAWKRDVGSGLIVLVPILISIYIVLWLYSKLSAVPILNEAINAELFGGNQALAEFVRVLLTIVIFAVLVLSIGYLMRTALGRLLEDEIDAMMQRVPILRVVYNASKMAVETALSGTDEFQRPVKLETWDGLRMTAFKTGQTTEDGREVLFLPTAPNITTGFVIEVEPERLTETNERVEDALTRIISAGFAEGNNGNNSPGPVPSSEEMPDDENEHS